jgi:hypothetical protein
MQTFLPYKSFAKSARALDNKRLNKQILEGYQILKVLNNPDPSAAWRNHPAVKMWRGHEMGLWNYITAMVLEANNRGIKTDKNMENLVALRNATQDNWGTKIPKWYTDAETMERLTTTHKVNLYRKDPTYYYQFGLAKLSEYNKPCCQDKKIPCQYFWVTHEMSYNEVA